MTQYALKISNQLLNKDKLKNESAHSNSSHKQNTHSGDFLGCVFRLAELIEYLTFPTTTKVSNQHNQFMRIYRSTIDFD